MLLLITERALCDSAPEAHFGAKPTFFRVTSPTWAVARSRKNIKPNWLTTESKLLSAIGDTLAVPRSIDPPAHAACDGEDPLLAPRVVATNAVSA